MHDKPKESDWKTFRKIVPELRERYLRRRNAELLAILQDESLTPTEQFWTVQERARKEAKILRECLDGHSRSKMLMFMIVMRRHKMLTDEDLKQFSSELQAEIEDFSNI
jgi:hypothetical protein